MMSAGSVGIGILTGGVGQAAGSLVGPAADAGKGIYNSLKRKYDYIKNLDQNFEKLDMEARYFSSREKDVKQKIDRNKELMEMTHECSTWLEDVGRMTRSLEELKTKYQNSSHGSCGPCQLHSCLKLSKEIVKMTKSLVDLRERLNHEHILVTIRKPDKVEKKFPKKIDEVPSLCENVEKLLEYLQDDKIKKVGVWGMSGIGKTTILENLNDKAQEHHMFEIVLWVTVSKEGSIHQIQQTILERLRVKAEGIDTESQAAMLISKSLESKKYLLLLDEVFSEIDLRRVGIHDHHSQGKVVLATRERVICEYMETDEEIRVKRLSRHDARKLFRDAVGEAVDHPHIKLIAERVLQQCGDLPQVIRAVGRQLKDKLNEDLWNNMLMKLRSPKMFQLKGLDDVINALKIIYEELPHALKGCFLYGALFPEDHEIYRDYLIECWKAEELIGIGETFRRAREEGHGNIEDLIERCIFDKCRSKKYVKMPIICRNTALKLAQEHQYGLLLKDIDELEIHLQVGQWRNAKVISLINSNTAELPERPECSKISALYLQKNHCLSVIPTSFFDFMPTLKILDLCGTGITFLPPCIANLNNLRGLYLNDCHKLMHLPQGIKELRYLEVLDICRTGICGFPIEIGDLTCLRCLRLSFTNAEGKLNLVEANGFDVIPLKAIQQLPQLEELSIDADPGEPRWNKIAPEVIAYLANLGKLSALSFSFPSIESLEVFTQTCISWKNGTSQLGSNLRSFTIYVGSYRTNNSSQLDVSKCSSQRYLQYAGGNDVPNVIKEVLRRACTFELIGHENITKFSDFGIDGMDSLELCLVEGCIAMTNIVQSPMSDTPAFPWLKELHLRKLHQLNNICQGPIFSHSFARLETLTLYDCPNMIKVVSWEMAKQLRVLQYLRVENCCHITEIIETDSQTSETGVLPKLRMLELVMLDTLASIVSNHLFEWHDLQKIEIIECDKLVNICLNTMNAKKLRHIRCSEAWWGKLLLSEQVKEHLHGFCCFIEV